MERKKFTFALVKYKDNTMQDYDILIKSEFFTLLQIKLQQFRKKYYNEKDTPLYRVIKIYIE